MRTPRILSPYILIQEILREEPWKLLCAVIMLNQTSAKQVWRVLPTFFDRWPDPQSFLAADPAEVSEHIKSLGFRNRRTQTLRKMTAAYVSGEWKEAIDLPGIGKYGSDSYRLFCEGYLVQDVEDKELRNYVRWANELRSAQVGRTHDDGQATKGREGPGAAGGGTGHHLREHPGVRGDLPPGPRAADAPGRPREDEEVA